jgi:hypothetical protein
LDVAHGDTVAVGDAQRAIVRRRLDEETALAGVAGDEEVERLERSVREHDLLDLDAVMRGEPRPQRPVAPRRTVVERRRAVGLEHGARAVGELGRRDALGGWDAARQRDGLHGVSLEPSSTVPPVDEWHRIVTVSSPTRTYSRVG